VEVGRTSWATNNNSHLVLSCFDPQARLAFVSESEHWALESIVLVSIDRESISSISLSQLKRSSHLAVHCRLADCSSQAAGSASQSSEAGASPSALQRRCDEKPRAPAEADQDKCPPCTRSWQVALCNPAWASVKSSSCCAT
jgi:hypothetical protein